MGKLKWSIGTDEPDELEGYDVYDGELPPRGVYTCKVKANMLKVKENKNGDNMINGLLLVEETGSKKQYNGYAIWFNQNVTEQGAPYVLQMLKAFGLTWKDFTGKTVVNDDDPPVITKIGSVKFGDNEPEVRVLCKREKYNGEDKLSVQTWLPPISDDDDDDDDDDEDEGPIGANADDGDEAPF